MGRRVVWITVWTTLSLWLGGITACSTQPEPTPAGLPDDRVKSVAALQEEMKHTVAQKLPPAATNDTAAVPLPPIQTNAVVPPPTDLSPATNPTGAVVSPEPGKTAALLPEGVVVAAPPLQIQGFDRSNWPKVTIRPTAGATTHHPVYFHDCPIPDSSATAMHAQASVEEQLAWAWSGAQAGNYSATNTLGLFVQPAKFCTDLILLPGRMVLQPPLQPVTTP